MKNRNRNQQGFSLVESLIVCLLMSFIASASMAMMIVINADAVKLQNKFDNLDAMRNALEKLQKVIRMGRSLGEVYGNIDGASLLNESTCFPSSKNPVYGAGQSPPGGWPTWADGSSTNPTGRPGGSYTLGNQTLVVQRPVFDNNGFPCYIPQGAGNPPVPSSLICVDNAVTDIFQVVPDNQNPGEFLLQWLELPGWSDQPNFAPTQAYLPDFVYTPRLIGPTTIARGIIGPKDASGNLRIFQYIEQPAFPQGSGPAGSTGPFPQDSISNALDLSYYTCVAINLEIVSHANSAAATKASTSAYKTEVYLRDNCQATTAGQ